MAEHTIEKTGTGLRRIRPAPEDSVVKDRSQMHDSVWGAEDSRAPNPSQDLIRVFGQLFFLKPCPLSLKAFCRRNCPFTEAFPVFCGALPATKLRKRRGFSPLTLSHRKRPVAAAKESMKKEMQFLDRFFLTTPRTRPIFPLPSRRNEESGAGLFDNRCTRGRELAPPWPLAYLNGFPTTSQPGDRLTTIQDTGKR